MVKDVALLKSFIIIDTIANSISIWKGKTYKKSELLDIRSSVSVPNFLLKNKMTKIIKMKKIIENAAIELARAKSP